MQDRMADVAAVMDANALESAALLGFSEGGPIAMHFAATYPGACARWCCMGHLPASHPSR